MPIGKHTQMSLEILRLDSQDGVWEEEVWRLYQAVLDH